MESGASLTELFDFPNKAHVTTLTKGVDLVRNQVESSGISPESGVNHTRNHPPKKAVGRSVGQSSTLSK